MGCPRTGADEASPVPSVPVYAVGLHAERIDDPAWAGTTADEVLAAVRADEYPAVVFLAYRSTVRAEHHAPPAVTTLTREECVDDEDYEQLTEFGRAFRTTPAGVHDVFADPSCGNPGFEGHAAGAHDDQEGIHRSFRTAA
ncbi:DUF6924 domain-containing protein [Streptomyces sp. NPDC001268]|uniref:DUF6924 domain-containing protein n=1 Tax=Streptomyces sp. NPDC001268 TaxID=3364553 RepID=UPI0036C72CC4